MRPCVTVCVCLCALVFVGLCLQDSLSNYSFIYYAEMDYPFEFSSSGMQFLLVQRFVPHPLSLAQLPLLAFFLPPVYAPRPLPLLTLALPAPTIPASCSACSTCVVVVNVINFKWKSTCNRIEARFNQQTVWEYVQVCVCVWCVYVYKQVMFPLEYAGISLANGSCKPPLYRDGERERGRGKASFLLQATSSPG